MIFRIFSGIFHNFFRTVARAERYAQVIGKDHTHMCPVPQEYSMVPPADLRELGW
jgi:hypothetical protein